MLISNIPVGSRPHSAEMEEHNFGFSPAATLLEVLLVIHINGANPNPCFSLFFFQSSPFFPLLTLISSLHPGETDELKVDFAPFSFSRLLK